MPTRLTYYNYNYDYYYYHYYYYHYYYYYYLLNSGHCTPFVSMQTKSVGGSTCSYASIAM